MAETGRTLHANLHLLDRQVVDAENGRLRGKVDDLELDLTSDPPVLAASLCGCPVSSGARWSPYTGACTSTASRARTGSRRR